MKRQVVLSRRPKIKLEKLLEYLENEWSEKSKYDFIEKLDKSLHIIQTNPESFQKTSIIKGIHKCVVTKQSTIYYRYASDSLQLSENSQKII